MGARCFPLIRGRMMRATRLDECGRLKPGAVSSIATDGFVSVALTTVVQDAEVLSVTNAAGKVAVEDKGSPEFRGYGVAITFVNVNPELYAMLTNQSVVLNSAGDAVGFRVNTGRSPAGANFALEVWSGVGSSNVCDAGAGAGYGYTLLPFISGGVLGDFTLENAAVTFTVTNAATKDGTQWGVGPYDVIDGAGGAAGPLLTPLDEQDHLHVQYTSIAPPAAACDALASGPEATGATAGSPATLTPADSYPPADFAALTADPLTASPTTAWTTGQYVVLGDDSRAYWNGTAWVAGTAS